MLGIKRFTESVTTNRKWHIGWCCYTNSPWCSNSVTCSIQPAALSFRSIKCCSGFCNTLILLVNFVFSWSLLLVVLGLEGKGWVEGFSCQTECKWVVICSVISCCALKKQILRRKSKREKNCYVWQSSMTCNMLHGQQRQIRQWAKY